MRALVDERLDASTVTSTTVRLVDLRTSKPVRAEVRYVASRHLVTIDPDHRLAHGRTYAVTVGTQVRDVSGNRLDQSARPGSTSRHLAVHHPLIRHTAGVRRLPMLLAVLLVGLVACAGSSAGHPASAASRAGATAPCGWRATGPATYDHVVWIILENHSYEDLVAAKAAPYLNRLARSCGLATNAWSVTHPSLPNYLALVSGSTGGSPTTAGRPAARSDAARCSARCRRRAAPGGCSRRGCPLPARARTPRPT